MKRLIVTADDFGAAVEVNDGVERAHRDGILTAASLMVDHPASRRAVSCSTFDTMDAMALNRDRATELRSKRARDLGAEIIDVSGEPIGRVTSGGFGPSIGAPIAMGYVSRDHAEIGAPVGLVVRGKPLPATVDALPFPPHAYYRG